MSKIILIIIALTAVIAKSALYVVDERGIALKLQLGEIVNIEDSPGLKVKTPFVNNIVFFDKRVQTLDEAPDLFLTGEKKNVIVDSYIKWKIRDVKKFYKSTGGTVARANNRLSQIVTTGLKDQFSKRTINEVVSGERVQIMKKITELVQNGSEEFGIDIIDVRIKRIDFPQDISETVFANMSSEREREAKEHRSQGREQAERIQASADRERTIILANAYRDSEKIRGDGDAISAKIYADAYNKDAEFYKFYRSLESYKKSFVGNSDIMILDINSQFFKTFNNQ